MMNKILTPKYPARALHFILKIGDRWKNIHFFKEVLGMKVLRHEEFSEEYLSGNGLSDTQFSKTLLGYGSENEYFAIELLWNSEIGSYDLGNDFLGMTIVSRDSIARAKARKWPVKIEEGINYVESPDGYRFFLIDEPQPVNEDPVVKIILSTTNIGKTFTYWTKICGMALVYYKKNRVAFTYDSSQVSFEFLQIDRPIDHGTANGKITFSIPFKDLQDVETISRDTNQKIILPMTCLDVHRKQMLNVVMLADFDGHEVCFVDDENFRKISASDPHGEAFLYYYMNKFEKKVRNSYLGLSEQLQEVLELKHFY